MENGYAGKRITPEMVDAAVKKNEGYDLVNRKWLGYKKGEQGGICTWWGTTDDVPCAGCALTHLSMAEGLDVISLITKDGADVVRTMSETLGLDQEYTRGFIRGFDDGINYNESVNGLIYNQGCEDGILVLNTLLKKNK